MKKNNIIDFLNEIDDKYIEETINIDTKEKFKEEVMKKNYNNSFWKWSTIALASIGVVSLGIVYFKNNGTNILKPEVSMNKYLSTNYGLMTYKSANEYINDNVDLDSLETGKTLKFNSSDLNLNTSSEYKYCKSTIEVERLPYDVYEYSIKSSCDNASADDVKFDVKVYTNVNKGGYEKEDMEKEEILNYYFLQGLEKMNNNFVGQFALPADMGYHSYAIFNNDLDMISFKTFNDEEHTWDGRLLNYSNDLYLVGPYYYETTTRTFTLYDKEFKPVWAVKYTENADTLVTYSYAYETSDDYVLIEERNNSNGSRDNRVVALNKKTGEKRNLFELEGEIAEYSSYDNIFYTYPMIYDNDKNIRKYDKNGNIINTISLNKITSENITSIYVNKSISLLKCTNNLKVIDNNGTVLKTITLDPYSIPEVQILADGFEILRDRTSSELYYDRYDLKGNLLYSEKFDLSYGHSMLENIGITGFDFDSETRDSEIMVNTFLNNYVSNNRVIEMLYLPDNNGTEILLSYDYTNSIKKNSSSSSNSNRQTVNTNSEFTDKDLVIAGVHLGLSKDEIELQLGKDYTYELITENMSTMTYKSKGITVYLNSAMYAEEILIENTSYKNARNLGINSTINEVINSYKKENIESFYFDNGEFKTGIYKGNKDTTQYIEVGFKGFIRYEYTSLAKMLFTFKDGKVSSIKLYHGANNDFIPTSNDNEEDTYTKEEKEKIDSAIVSYEKSYLEKKFKDFGTPIVDAIDVNSSCQNTNNKSVNCSVSYKVWFSPYDKKKCNNYKTVALHPITCENDYMQGEQVYTLEKQNDKYVVVATATGLEEDLEPKVEEGYVDDNKHLGYWYQTHNYYANENTLELKYFKNNNTYTGNFYITRTANFNITATMTSEKDGTFEGTSEFGNISGLIKIQDEFIKMQILSSTVKDLKASNNTLLYIFTNHTDYDIAVINYNMEKNYKDSLNTYFNNKVIIDRVDMSNTKCMKENNVYSCRSNYYLTIRDYDKSKCDSYKTYTSKYYSSNTTCYDDHIGGTTTFQAEKVNGDYKVKSSSLSKAMSDYVYNENFIAYTDSKTYNNDFRIDVLKTGELVLYKHDYKTMENRGKNIYLKLPYYVPLDKIDKDNNTYNRTGYYADYNNNGSGQIRIRIDKYAIGSTVRQGYIWYYIDGDTGNVVNIQEYDEKK